MKCPECGCTISDNVEFCPGCGQPVRTRTIYPGKAHVKAISVRCPWCDEMIPPGKKNCPNCGSPAKVTYNTQEDERGPYARKGSSGDDWEWHPPKNEKTKTGPSAWVFILIAVIVIAFTVWAIHTIRSLPPKGETSAQAGAVLGGFVVSDALFDLQD